MATWDLSTTKHHVLICNGGSCMRNGGEEVTQAIREEISACGLDDTVHTTRTRCNGRCEDASVVIVYPQGIWYKNMTPELGKQLIKHDLAGDRHLDTHITYSYQEDHFQPSEGAVPGRKKSD
ncbi:(2Fe-2S) ferredoxin domain-containing protein [Caldalkalibacillus salinus]|uniref:(2Fe-2S) ferredoxin domain-containing protein n=1 Tax=Caldalkalibacillus salinus TaxID=2803787 RepID=UPI001921CE16|nr:(2Fe-2S) ferredoxin domain-containing protein [Caldalkalibacillus salinus]